MKKYSIIYADPPWAYRTIKLENALGIPSSKQGQGCWIF